MRKQMITSEIKAIVFDLDGTLYEDTHHFKYYAESISNRLPQKLHEKFIFEYDSTVSGSHTLKVGRIYDTEKDFIIEHITKKLKKVYTWDGTVVEKSIVKELYNDTIEIDMQRFISIGDLWWVPGVIGLHYGLNRTDIHACFLETRKYMMSNEFIMKPVKGFKETLEYLNPSIKLILLTNSPEPDSETILKKIDIQHLFHKKIFEGKKPSRTLERFEEVCNEFHLSFNEILSVGDNFINDILPAKKAGCKAIYIDNYHIGNKEDADYVVYSISEMIDIIKTLKSDI
jgi:HAD superfamily hydrolase (TIGR01549 family)